MANLRGSNFEKQIKNALIRLDSRGQKRFNTNSHKTHSNALYKKRAMQLRDYARFAENKGLSGKLNTHFTPENIADFLEERLQDLSPKSSIDYITGFNSMLRGLEQTRVSINPEAKEVLKEYTNDFRNEFNQVKDSYETGRAIQNTNTFLSSLQEIRESSAVIATLQLETGLRASEALEVSRNFQDYYNPQNSALEGIIGKGGQEYDIKPINEELAYKLNNLQQIPSYSSYYKDLKELDQKPHNLRITFAKIKFEELRENGSSYKESLKIVSKELNHHRESITIYYLKRA